MTTDRIALEAELARVTAFVASLSTPPPQDVPCTCGSGGHPRACDRHPWNHQRHIDSLNAEYGQQTIDELETEREQLRAELARVTGELEWTRADVQVAVQRWEAAEAERDQLRAELTAAHQRIGALEVAAAIYREAGERWSTDLSDARDQLESTNADMHELAQQLTAARGRSKDLERAAQTLVSERCRLDDRVVELEADLTAAREREAKAVLERETALSLAYNAKVDRDEARERVALLEGVLLELSKGRLSMRAGGGAFCAWCNESHYYHRDDTACPRAVAARALVDARPPGGPGGVR